MYKLDNNQQNNKYDIDRFYESNLRIRNLFISILLIQNSIATQTLATFGTYRVLDEEGRPDLLTERIYGLEYTVLVDSYATK